MPSAPKSSGLQHTARCLAAAALAALALTVADGRALGAAFERKYGIPIEATDVHWFAAVTKSMGASSFRGCSSAARRCKMATEAT